jgi:hypothetical protein
MNEIEQDDLLDRQLREAAPYIDDAGFTARVLQKLPQKRSHRESQRAFIMIGMAVFASLLAYFLSDGGRFVAVAVERLAVLPMLWVFALALATGILVTAGGLAAALNRNAAQARL